MVASTWSILLLILVAGFGSSRLQTTGGQRKATEKYVGIRGRRGIITDGSKLLKDTGKLAVKYGQRLLKRWEVNRILLNGAKLHAQQFSVDHYVKLGDMQRARDDFFSIRNRLQDLKMERYEHGDLVTLITRVGDRVVKLKQNYNEKSSTITFLRPGNPDRRESGIVVHYCKLDRSTLCKVDNPFS